MNRLFVADVDLLDPRRQLAPADAAARVLVWAGPHVLGEVNVHGYDRPWPELRDELLDHFGDAADALSVVRHAVPGGGVAPSDVTVVVCTRERPAYLEACLVALRALDPAPAEILIVDNAPQTTATAELAARFGLRRIVEPQPGLSHARNAGLLAVTTPVIAYTDDDARPHPRWVGALCGGFLADEVACVTGLVIAAELESHAQRVFEFNGGMSKGYSPRLFTHADVGLQGWLLGAGANMAFRREVIAALGGFDVRVGPGRPTRGGDDLDAFIRVLASGALAAYEPDAVVRHVHRRDIVSLAKQYRDNGAGYAALLRKYELGEDAWRAAAHAERRRWRRERHIMALLRALRWRDYPQLLEIGAEILGSRHGAAAFDAEEPWGPLLPATPAA